jgi:hypothetical protein
LQSFGAVFRNTPHELRWRRANAFTEITAGKEPAKGCSSARPRLTAGIRQPHHRADASSYP